MKDDNEYSFIRKPIFTHQISRRSSSDNNVGLFLHSTMNKFIICSGQKISYEDGSYFFGQIVNNKPHGLGYNYFKDGSYYKGYFFNGLKHGFGFYQKNNSIEQCCGEWINGSLNGIGYETFADGSYYEGEFLDGIKHGIGTYILKDGQKYTGSWKNNMFHGEGIYKFTKKK